MVSGMGRLLSLSLELARLLHLPQQVSVNFVARDADRPSRCGLIQLGAYGGGPPLYRLRKLEAFALADILQWNVNIQSSE